jgi:hypothetical protein
MRYIIEDDSFTFMVDWSKKNKVSDGFEEEYFPSCGESIEALMRLLQNVYPAETIADTLAKGLDAMDYSESGRKARNLLVSIPERDE